MKDIGVFDIETTDWNNIEAIGFYDGESYKSFDISSGYWTLTGDFYDGESYKSFDINNFKNEKGIIQQSIMEFIQSDVDIWFAHNGGKFDFKFFLEELLNNYYVDMIYNNSSLIKIQVYDKVVAEKYKDGRYKGNKPKKSYKLFTLKDSLALLPLSLEELTKGFDVEHKKLDYDDYEHKNRKEMHKYLKFDCIGLYEVVKKFINTMDIKKLKLTIGSQALNEYKQRFNGKEYMKNLKPSPHKEDIFRKAYFGGRTEVFNRFGENLYYYDFHSMYPSVMKNKKYPCGKLVRTNRVREDKIGIYKVRWEAPTNNIPLLPIRNTKNKLIFPIGKGEGWYYSPELKYAKELGYDIEVIKGYFWTDKQEMFKEYVDYFYKIKQRSDGSKYLISKLFLNSLYGKFGQNREISKVMHRRPTYGEVKKNKIEIISDKYNLFTKDKELYSTHIYPYIAGLVTSYGRVKLHKALNKDHTVYYCDTDSLIVDKPIKTKDKLGYLGLEDKIKVGYFLYPKVYAYKNDKNEIVTKAKGFKRNTLGLEDYKQALNGDLSGFKSNWETLVGFLEGFSRKIANNFKDKINKKKSLLGKFDKRELIDNIHTKPIVWGD